MSITDAEMNHFKRTLLFVLGFLFTILGVVGVLMPVMPSVPFLIIASICFSKSSAKFHNLLMSNKWVGPHIKKYHENSGIKLEIKIFFIVAQWTGILFTTVFFVHNFLGKILLIIIAAGVTIHILSLKTSKS